MEKKVLRAKKENVMKSEPEKAWAVMFKHSLGWTATEIVFVEKDAETCKKKWEKKLTGFKYKVVPCVINYSI